MFFLLGSAVLLRGHIRWNNINILSHSCHDPLFGWRFLNSDKCYDPDLSNVFLQTSKKLQTEKFTLYEDGVYSFCLGPVYETAMEIQVFCV